MKLPSVLLSTFFLSLFFTSSVFSASPVFERAVWIPYWKKTEGASSTLANLGSITQISPFAYELQPNGTLKNAFKIDQEPWLTLMKEAKKKNVKIYPSILSYPSTITEKRYVFDLLSDPKKRKAHVQDIVKKVVDNKFDGIDIDYEAKVADIKPHFSAFLNELSVALHKNNKKLICTIEPRTPPESRYATTSKEVLSKVWYANDYKAIGKACDQVRIMAYDQSTDDAKLVNQNKITGKLYAPVADIEWVKKIVTVALWDIPAKKIIIGVPTYGYKYEVKRDSVSGAYKYRRIGSMNFNYADDLVKSLKQTPLRNSAGELSFTYSTTTGVNGESLNETKQYLVWYSDSVAIAEKISLAKLYKLGGVAVFKVDGGNDPKLWSVLK
jgi:spore germination protein YaaH